MSNASAAARAATSRAPAATPADVAIPDDAPERQIAALFVKNSPVSWKLPLALNQRFPHLRCGASTDDRTIVVRCVLPMPPASLEEQRHFRVAPGVPTVEIRLSEACVHGVLSACLTVNIPCDALSAITRAVGMVLPQLQPMRGVRPFTEPWTVAVSALTTTLTDMWWQADALLTSRDAVHRARQLVRQQLADVQVPTWVLEAPAAPGGAA